MSEGTTTTHQRCPRCGALATEEGQPSKRRVFACGTYSYEETADTVRQSDVCALRQDLAVAKAELAVVRAAADCATDRLDASTLGTLIARAFEANHPAILEYIAMRFRLRELEKEIAEYKRIIADPAAVWVNMLTGKIARPRALDHYEECKAMVDTQAKDISSLKQRLFEMQNAAINIAAKEKAQAEEIERLRKVLNKIGTGYYLAKDAPKILDRYVDMAKEAIAASSGEVVSDASILDWLENNFLSIQHDRATCSVDMSGNKVTGQVLLPNKSSSGTRRPRIRAKSIRALVIEAMALDDPIQEVQKL